MNSELVHTIECNFSRDFFRQSSQIISIVLRWGGLAELTGYDVSKNSNNDLHIVEFYFFFSFHRCPCIYLIALLFDRWMKWVSSISTFTYAIYRITEFWKTFFFHSFNSSAAMKLYNCRHFVSFIQFFLFRQISVFNIVDILQTGAAAAESRKIRNMNSMVNSQFRWKIYYSIKEMRTVLLCGTL
jgi:hypothetical protein